MAEEERTDEGRVEIEVKSEEKADFDPADFGPSLIAVWKEVVTKPAEFFARMPKDGGFVNPFIFMAVCLFVSGILAAIVRRGIGGLGNAILFVVMAFVYSAILYLFATKLFEGKGNYEGTFRVVAYAGAMSVLFWVPVIVFLAWLYQLYLTAVGMREIHNMEMGKVAVVIILTWVVLFVLSLVLSAPLLIFRGGFLTM